MRQLVRFAFTGITWARWTSLTWSWGSGSQHRLMNTPPLLFFSILAVIAPAIAPAAELFDGKTLNGWEGDAKWWRVVDSAITGGSLTEKVPRNFFLATTRSFQNFDL